VVLLENPAQRTAACALGNTEVELQVRAAHFVQELGIVLAGDATVEQAIDLFCRPFKFGALASIGLFRDEGHHPRSDACTALKDKLKDRSTCTGVFALPAGS
jgi:hypothetical protein